MTRKGLTLIEALVAMFIAALGMIGILTLFPLGALQMGQALKDSRTSQAAQEADGLLRWHWAKYGVNEPTTFPVPQALDQGSTLNGTVTATPLPAGTTGCSYPVFIDPVNKTSFSNAIQRTAVASLRNFPREVLYIPTTAAGSSTVTASQLLDTNAKIARFCILQDDLTYATNAGEPAAGQVVERGGRYNWCWVLQRPNQSQPGVINVKVLVFDQRPVFFTNSQTETTFSNVSFAPGSTQLTLSYSGTRPPVLKGRWICDSTPSLRHANFYRVASVNDETPGTLYVELETPIRRNDTSTATYTGTVVVFNGLAEVFDRPPLVAADARK